MRGIIVLKCIPTAPQGPGEFWAHCLGRSGSWVGSSRVLKSDSWQSGHGPSDRHRLLSAHISLGLALVGRCYSNSNHPGNNI